MVRHGGLVCYCCHHVLIVALLLVEVCCYGFLSLFDVCHRSIGDGKYWRLIVTISLLLCLLLLIRTGCWFTGCLWWCRDRGAWRQRYAYCCFHRCCYYIAVAVSCFSRSSLLLFGSRTLAAATAATMTTMIPVCCWHCAFVCCCVLCVVFLLFDSSYAFRFL